MENVKNAIKRYKTKSNMVIKLSVPFKIYHLIDMQSKLHFWRAAES